MELEARFASCPPALPAQSQTLIVLRAALEALNPNPTNAQCSDLEEQIAALEASQPYSPITFPGDEDQPGRCFPRVLNALVMAINRPAASIFDTDVVPGATGSAGASAFFSMAGLNAADEERGPGATHGLQSYLSRPRPGSATFRVDMLSLLRKARAADPMRGQEAAALQNGVVVPGQPQVDSDFNVWVSGRYVDFDNNTTDADLSGRVGWISVGASYRLAPKAEVGVIGRYRSGAVSSQAVPAKLDADMYGGGIYAVLPIFSELRLRAGALYERGDNHINIQRTFGTFDTDHWTFEALLDKRFSFDNVWLEPEAGLLYMHIDRSNYATSCPILPGACGQQTGAGTVELGRATYGARFGIAIASATGEFRSIEPFASVKGIWEFENEGDLEIGSLRVVAGTYEAPTHGVDLGAGLNVAFSSGAVLALGANYFVYDNDLEGWYLSGGLGVPF